MGFLLDRSKFQTLVLDLGFRILLVLSSFCFSLFSLSCFGKLKILLWNMDLIFIDKIVI